MSVRLISMLRGINVGGHKIVKMDALKTAYEALGYVDVITYVQSGNVIFSPVKYDKRTLETLTTHLRASFGFDIPVILRTHDDMLSIVEQNPFASDPGIETDKLHVTFLAETPDAAHVATLKGHTSGEDACQIVGNEIYLHCPNGYGKTKLNNTFFEKKLAVGATTRNWNTVKKLLALSGDVP